VGRSVCLHHRQERTNNLTVSEEKYEPCTERAEIREDCVNNTKHIANDFLALSKLVKQIDFIHGA